MATSGNGSCGSVADIEHRGGWHCVVDLKYPDKYPVNCADNEADMKVERKDGVLT